MRVGNVPELADGPALVRLIRLILKTRPDIIHAHSSKAGALARFAASLLCHPRCIYTPHAYYGMAKPPSLKVHFFNWVEKILGRKGITVAISQDEAAFARKVLGIHANRISIIHNPVDADRFNPATQEERQKARAKLEIPEHAVVLATIGRMCWQKDPETAYSGVAPVCAKNPDLIFLHLGWGKWKDYLLGYAQHLGFGSQLRIIDYTDNPLGFYHAIDGLIVSSRYEAGWPLVLLEALACNLPVITSTCVGMSDIGNARLSHLWTFQSEDVAGCTVAIRLWLGSYSNGIQGCNHRDFTQRRLSPERSFGALFDLYCSKPLSGNVTPLD
jgi:glycosyltransferase involved in cell wall biosynthesis